MAKKYNFDLSAGKTAVKKTEMNKLTDAEKRKAALLSGLAVNTPVKATQTPSAVSKPLVPDVRLTRKEALLEPKVAPLLNNYAAKSAMDKTSQLAGRAVGTSIKAPIASNPVSAGFQYGAASAFGGKQLGNGAISQNLKAKQAEDEKAFNIARGAGQFVGTAGQYMLANQAVNSAAKVVPLLGNLSKAGKVAATIGTDQLVDNIVRTPQTILQGRMDNKSGMEIAKDVGKQNVEDLAWNVGMAAGGVALGRIADIIKANKKPVAEAMQDPVIRKTIQEELGLNRELTAQEYMAIQKQLSDEIETQAIKATNERNLGEAFIKDFDDVRTPQFNAEAYYKQMENQPKPLATGQRRVKSGILPEVRKQNEYGSWKTADEVAKANDRQRLSYEQDKYYSDLETAPKRYANTSGSPVPRTKQVETPKNETGYIKDPDNGDLYKVIGKDSNGKTIIEELETQKQHSVSDLMLETFEKTDEAFVRNEYKQEILTFLSGLQSNRETRNVIFNEHNEPVRTVTGYIRSHGSDFEKGIVDDIENVLGFQPSVSDLNKVAKAMLEGKTISKNATNQIMIRDAIEEVAEKQTKINVVADGYGFWENPLKQSAVESEAINVYRGYASGKTEADKNLSRRLDILDVIGRPKKTGQDIPMFYYTESAEVAGKYANQDANILLDFKNRLKKTDDEAIAMFETLYGRKPVSSGVVKSHKINPKKVFDISNLGESTDHISIINKMLEAEGSPIPKYVRGENVNSDKWKRFNEIEREMIVNNYRSADDETFPVFSMLRNASENDVSGTMFFEWLKKNGYDAVRYSEDGTKHYAVMNKAVDEAVETTVKSTPVKKVSVKEPIKPTAQVPEVKPKQTTLPKKVSKLEPVFKPVKAETPVPKPSIEPPKKTAQTAPQSVTQASKPKVELPKTKAIEPESPSPKFDLQIFSKQEFQAKAKPFTKVDKSGKVERYFSLDGAEYKGKNIDEAYKKYRQTKKEIIAEYKAKQAEKEAARDWKKVEKESDKIQKEVDRVESINNKYNDGGSRERFSEQINYDKKKKKRSVSEVIEGLKRDFVDDLAPLEKAEREIYGKLQSAEDSLYKTARNEKRSSNLAEQIIKADLEPILKGVEKTGKSYRDLGEYALAVHTRDINAKGIVSGFDNSDIEKTIAELGTSEMEAARKELVSISNKLLDMMEESGLLSNGQVKAMREKHPNYMPLFRHFDDEKVEFISSFGESFSKSDAPIFSLKGSERQINDPIENMLKNIYRSVDAAKKNDVGKQLIKLAEADTNGTFARIVEGAESTNRKNVVSAMVDGKQVKIEVEPELFKAFTGMNKETTNKFIQILSKPASVLRAGATLSPEFAARNPMRDMVEAFTKSESGFNPIVDFPKGLASVIKKDEYYDLWMRSGGGGTGIISHDIKAHRKGLIEGLKKPTKDKMITLVNPNSFLDLLRGMSEITEEATRLGEFKKALKGGASPQEAAYRSADLMDFSRSGASVRQVNRVVAFFNANIQGKSKLIRAIKENPKQATTKAVTSMAIPTVAIFGYNQNFASKKQKQTIDDAPDWQKNTFWLIASPFDDEYVIRIPKPFELSIVANATERFMEFAVKKDEKAFDDFFGQTIKDQGMPIMPTGLIPIIEGATNYSMFRQSSIVPERERYVKRENQYDYTTSEVSKGIAKGVRAIAGEKSNFSSPRVVDYMLKSSTGGLGTYALDATDALLDALGIADRPTKAKKDVTQMPLLKGFTVNSLSSGKSIGQLYDIETAFEKEKKTMRDELGSNYDNNAEYKKLKDDTKKISVVTDELSDISKEIRDINNSKTMSAQAKQKKLKELNNKRNKIAYEFAKELEKAKWFKERGID